MHRFGKEPETLIFCVHTCSQEARQDAVKLQDFNRYCRYRGREDIKRYLYADDSELLFFNENDSFFVVK